MADKVHFEYLGEDQDFPNAKVWKVEAIHVTTTRNKRKFTSVELEASGRSLSFRPLNINHERSRGMAFPDNATLAMNFNPISNAVEGSFRVNDPAINAMIESGRIKQVSIEQIPTQGEDCTSQIFCEQHGVAFIGLALLESDVLPGDPNANIKIESLIVSDEQRTCKTCSDHEQCDSCIHKKEKANSFIMKQIKTYHEKDESLTKDQILSHVFWENYPEGAPRNEAYLFYGKGCKAWKDVFYPSI